MHANRAIAAGLAAALLALSAPAAASHGAGEGGGHDAFPGLPDPAMYGICNAFGHAPDAALGAPPLAWLAPDACQDAERPGGPGAAGGGPPDGAGPPG